MQYLYLALALAAGMLMPVQAGINVKLGAEVGGPIPSAFISFLVGTLALGLVLAAMRQGIPVTRAVAVSPWWYWIGGTFGAFFVAVSVIIAPRIGAASMMAFMLAGQIVSSLLLDQFGLLGYPEIPITAKRLAGTALLAVGVYLIRF